jgi:oligopeptide/dipeptide ABC transporter ATP-binding protein
MSSAAQPLLRVDDLSVQFSRGRGLAPLKAVDRVSLTVDKCETVGLVGESGAGKSTIGRAVLGLEPVSGGTITFAGADITQADHRKRRALSRELQVVFQDPYSSLNPSRSIGQTLGEPLRVLGKLAPKDVAARVAAMLDRVGLPTAAADRYPARFSGGQRQRIAIARALMVEPRLVICDEPVTALDVSVQAQVLNLLAELQSEFSLSYLFVAHDLDVVRHVSQRIVVLYHGQIVEQGPAETVYSAPQHPYTRMLLAAVPVPDPVVQRERRAARTAAARRPPTTGTGCPLVGRCPHAIEICDSVRPALEQTPAGTFVACHRWQEIERKPGVSGGRAPGALAPTGDRTGGSDK